MKIIDAIRINYKKLRYRTAKALFLIIPITILVALGIIITSQVGNFQTATDKSIFGEIKEESTLIEISKQMEDTRRFQGGGMFNINNNQYTEADLASIKGINNVLYASINYSVPISNIVTTNLFEGKKISFGQIMVLDPGMASVYTSENFQYKEGKSIPIILNASSFTETYEDWGDQNEITIDMRAMREGMQDIKNIGDMRNLTPIKTKAVSYSKEDLLGKEFTITLGGFTDINDYEVERSMGVETFQKLTTDEISELEDQRKDTIEKYWNYDKLAQGLTYTFKVVGIIEEQGLGAVYIPKEFADSIMKQYIGLQIESRNSNDISASLLNNTYTGLTYDGTELSGSNNSFGFGRMMSPMGERSDETDTSESYEIPGLVIEVSESDSNDIKGIYEDSSVFESAVKTGDKISIKINTIYDREQVIKDLNGSGYAYQDINNLDVFNKIQNSLKQILTGVIIAFIVLTTAVIILAMGKFVSDSTKEIGIFRAVGFTKGNIVTIFLCQSILYTLVGYIAGVTIGFIGNVVTASFIGNWFDNFIANTIKQTFNVVNNTDYSIFLNLDLSSLGILTGILAIIVLTLSFIPAIKASNVSPVEAIKNE